MHSNRNADNLFVYARVSFRFDQLQRVSLDWNWWNKYECVDVFSVHIHAWKLKGRKESEIYKRPRPKHLCYYSANNKSKKRLQRRNAKRGRAKEEKKQMFPFSGNTGPAGGLRDLKVSALERVHTVSVWMCRVRVGAKAREIYWEKEVKGAQKRKQQQTFFSPKNQNAHWINTSSTHISWEIEYDICKRRLLLSWFLTQSLAGMGFVRMYWTLVHLYNVHPHGEYAFFFRIYHSLYNCRPFVCTVQHWMHTFSTTHIYTNARRLYAYTTRFIRKHNSKW